MVTALTSSSGTTKLKFNDVQDLILNEEIRRRESGEASTSSALHTEAEVLKKNRIVADRCLERANRDLGRKILLVTIAARRVTLKRTVEHRRKILA